MAFLRSFVRFRDEAALIGRMVAGYADLEIALMNCVHAPLKDLDTVLREMFNLRGETRRINKAVELGRATYGALQLENEFDQAVESMRACLKIRNQYAHCDWYDDLSGQLAFVNLEELAQAKERIVDLRHLTIHHVDVPFLSAQLNYFHYTQQFIDWLNVEGRRRGGEALPEGMAPRPDLQRVPPFHLA